MNEDVKKRAEEFNKKLKKLLGEFKFQLTAVPYVTADGRITARPTIAEVLEPAPEQAPEETAAVTEA